MASPAQTVPASAIGASGAERLGPAKKGLHFAFDASISMCGFLNASDPRRTLLTLIKRASGLKDPQRNNRVLLIRQETETSGNVENAPLDFEALVDRPDRKRGVADKCAPFDGKYSDVRLVFAPATREPVPVNSPRRMLPPPALARSMVLVSDLSLKEKWLLGFAESFRAWALEQSGGADPVSAGIATLPVPFSGLYYSETDNSAAGRSGYALPDHTRLLSVAWFLTGADDIKTVRALFDELGVTGGPASGTLAYGVQLLPVATEDSSRWLLPQLPLKSAAELFGEPTMKIDAPNSERDAGVLRRCASAKLESGRLVVRAGRKCQDGKPFFDSIRAIDIVLPLDPARGITLKSAGAGAAVRGGALLLRFERSSKPGTADVPLDVGIAEPALDRVKQASLTAPNDSCVERPQSKAASAAHDAWVQGCLKRLQSKVYLYETLMKQFSDRAYLVASEQLAKTPLALTVVFER